MCILLKTNDGLKYRFKKRSKTRSILTMHAKPISGLVKLIISEIRPAISIRFGDYIAVDVLN